MFDIRWIRENAVAFDQALAKRGYEASAAKLIALDDSRRSHITKLQEAQERRNAASKEIGKAKGSGDDARAQELIDEVAQIKAFIQSGEEEERKLIADLEAAMAVIPNLPHDDVPVGEDEAGNVLLKTHGENRSSRSMKLRKNTMSWAKTSAAWTLPQRPNCLVRAL